MEDVKTIHVIIEFLAHPLVVSVVTIALGSYFLDRINKKREKREKKIDGAIKLAEEISTILNADLSNLFLQIRSQKFDLISSFVDASLDAFKNRLKFKIRIVTYFDDDKLYNDYVTLIKEISAIKQSINKFLQSPEEEKLYIQKRIAKLKSQWNITNYSIEQLNEPFDLYFSWAQIIWYKVEQYSSYLYAKSLDVK